MFGGTITRLPISEYQQSMADISAVILTMSLGQTGVMFFVTIQFDFRKFVEYWS